MSAPAITRREALLAAAAASGAALLAGCGSSAAAGPAPGSTLERTLVDPRGSGRLSRGPGVPLRDRTELASASARGTRIATLAQISDLHVHDAQSPARVPFLDRAGRQFASAFRPHETLMALTLAGALPQIDAAGADAVVVSGDLIDSAQRNELDWVLGILAGGRVWPDSGGRGYAGVQAASNPDPLFYRPDVDPPRHRGLLDDAIAPLRSPGLRTPWLPVLGNHDVLVQGALGPTAATRSVATGRRLIVSPDAELLRLGRGGRITPAHVDALLRGGLPGRAISVAADPNRTHLDAADVVARLRDAATAPLSPGPEPARLDHHAHIGEQVELITLDLARRDAGSGGLVTASTTAFLAAALQAAGDRWIVVACHQPLESASGAAAAFALLDGDPRVVAVLSGHTHRNRITPRRTPAGGYWLITTCSLIDWPQQWRMLALRDGAGGALSIETWLVDHPGRPEDDADAAGIARDLAYIDVQGGRPAGAAGDRGSGNVRLHLPARARRPGRVGRVPQVPAGTAPPRSSLLGDSF